MLRIRSIYLVVTMPQDFFHGSLIDGPDWDNNWLVFTRWKNGFGNHGRENFEASCRMANLEKSSCASFRMENWFFSCEKQLYERLCLSVRPSIRLSVCPSVRPSIRPSVSPSVHPYIRPSLCPSVLPSVRRWRVLWNHGIWDETA